MKKLTLLFLIALTANAAIAGSNPCDITPKDRKMRLKGINKRIGTVKLDVEYAQQELDGVVKELKKKKRQFGWAYASGAAGVGALLQVIPGAAPMMPPLLAAIIDSSGVVFSTLVPGIAVLASKGDPTPSPGPTTYGIHPLYLERIENFLRSPDCYRNKCTMDYPYATQTLERIETEYENKVRKIKEGNHWYLPHLITRTKIKLVRHAELPRSFARLMLRETQLRFYQWLKHRLTQDQKLEKACGY